MIGLCTNCTLWPNAEERTETQGWFLVKSVFKPVFSQYEKQILFHVRTLKAYRIVDGTYTVYCQNLLFFFKIL